MIGGLGSVFLAASLAAALLAGPAGAAPGPDHTLPIRVEPGGLSRAGVTPAWVEHYDAFDWAEVRATELPGLKAAGVSFEARLDVRTLVLPRVSFDPLESVPGTEISRSGTLHLVQLRGPTKDLWIDAIRARGARFVQFIAPFSYVVLLRPADAGAVASLPFVRWVGAFAPEWRIPEDLPPEAVGMGALILDDGAIEESLRAFESLGVTPEVAERIPFMDVDGVGFRLPADDRLIAKLTTIPTLYSLSPIFVPQLRDEMSDQIVAHSIAPTTEPEPGYREWLETLGLSGEGVIVAHVDSGVDMGHADLADRIAGCQDYDAGGLECTIGFSDSLGHGTHTAGIIVGTGSAGGTDSAGYLYGLGMAPGAMLYVQNFVGLSYIVSRTTQGPAPPGTYMGVNRDSVLAGATISANSWGPSGSPQGYDADTREFDHAPRDADIFTRKKEPLAFVLSIMNGGGGRHSQGTPDEGKNLIRVGATNNLRAGSVGDLATFSAHGPALDGRRLPDLVAPGATVFSTRSRAATPPICGTPPGDEMGVPDPDGLVYAGCSGTSMASPHVSGGAAIFTEYYRRRFNKDPSPALIKAAFINGAVDLEGGLDADGKALGHVPDSRQGWGRFNLSNVLTGRPKLYLDQELRLHHTGGVWDLSLHPADPKKPVKVTLVWTDAPGHGLGGPTPAWVNDLDLRVTTERGTTYLGNAFGSPSTGWSVPGGRADFRNNVENVFLRRGAGKITIEVVAANIAAEGVPGNGDPTDQDFALVVANARLVRSG